jgi:hypothetical protein
MPKQYSCNDRDINQQVAFKTGEDSATIERMGFGALGPVEIEERQEPLVVDWDLLDATR